MHKINACIEHLYKYKYAYIYVISLEVSGNNASQTNKIVYAIV